MEHKRIRTFNTKETYPEQNLDNDLCQAVVARGAMVFLRGQVAQDLETRECLHVGDPTLQTRKTMENIKMLLEEAGSSKHDLVFVQVLLKTMDFYAPMNEVYGAWLEGVEIKPTRAAFAVDALPADALVEIVVQAVKQD